MKSWAYIKLPYATFAIELDLNIVVAAPPIAKWMVGKEFDEINKWVTKKKGTCKLIKTNDARPLA